MGAGRERLRRWFWSRGSGFWGGVGFLPGEHAQRHTLGFIGDLERVESSPAFFGPCLSDFGASAPFLDLDFQLTNAFT
ncbi:MAG: hypothetical protein DI613_14150 [Kocuria rhizophila]|nr:MAG: hypothetical protein DI613_14150 [Kocuria rhizophila]